MAVHVVGDIHAVAQRHVIADCDAVDAADVAARADECVLADDDFGREDLVFPSVNGVEARVFADDAAAAYADILSALHLEGKAEAGEVGRVFEAAAHDGGIEGAEVLRAFARKAFIPNLCRRPHGGVYYFVEERRHLEDIF